MEWSDSLPPEHAGFCPMLSCHCSCLLRVRPHCSRLLNPVSCCLELPNRYDEFRQPFRFRLRSVAHVPNISRSSIKRKTSWFSPEGFCKLSYLG